MDKHEEQVPLLEELDGMTPEDVIEGMQERSLDDIIREVAEEEGLTEEEVRRMVEGFQGMKFQVPKKKRHTKKKRTKNKNRLKQIKQSKKRNR